MRSDRSTSAGDRPDFYLTSSEDLFWAEPRACRVDRRCEDGRLEVRIDPPAVGQPFGRGSDVDRLIVAPRFEGDDLAGAFAFPVHVHLLVALDDGTLSHAAWGELAETVEEAAKTHERARAADRASA